MNTSRSTAENQATQRNKGMEGTTKTEVENKEKSENANREESDFENRTIKYNSNFPHPLAKFAAACHNSVHALPRWRNW